MLMSRTRLPTATFRIVLQDRQPSSNIATRPSTNERSEEHTSELQSLMRSSYAVFCLKKKTKQASTTKNRQNYDIQPTYTTILTSSLTKSSQNYTSRATTT